MQLIVGFCDDCLQRCDGSRMEFLIEVRGRGGSVVVVAPANNAYLDNRAMLVEQIPVGLEISQIEKGNIGAQL